MYKIKDLKQLNTDSPYYTELTKELKLIKKWSKNGVVKCKVESISGYEYIVAEDNLEKIKTKSNKKNKK
tara:strand:- start:1485 stop:1691 length:207 start_codon:yes stop_codon:yes gene_type:complete